MSERFEDLNHESRGASGAGRGVDRRSILKSAVVVAGGAAAAGFLPESGSAQGNNQPERILIRGGRIISMDSGVGDFDSGDVLIERGAIASVGRNLSASSAEVIDASGKLVLPGLIDAHRHGWMTHLRTVQVPANFLTFHAKVMLPLFRPEDAYAGTLLGCLDSMNAGITTTYDFSHCMFTDEFGDAVMRAHKEAGMRTVIGFALPHVLRPKELPNALDGARRFQKKFFSTTDPLLSFSMGIRLGTSRATDIFGPEIGVPLDNAIHDIRLGRELGAKRLHFHIVSVTDIYKANLLGPDLCFVHAGGQTDDQVKMVGDSGGTVVLTPVNEAAFSMQRFHRAGVVVGTGMDDGPGAANDLFAAVRMLLKNDRVVERDLAAKAKTTAKEMTFRKALETATTAAAKCIGLEDQVGSLTPGKRADVILIDLDNMTYPLDQDPLPTVITQATPADVSWVIVEGRIRKRDGRVVGIDRARVKKVAQASYEYLIQKANVPPNR